MQKHPRNFLGAPRAPGFMGFMWDMPQIFSARFARRLCWDPENK
jgi:hypothetical protein